MNKKNKTTFISVLIFIVLFIVIFLIVQAYRSSYQRTLVNTNNSYNDQLDDIYLFNFDDEELLEKQEDISNLKQLASTISMGFGSYSYYGDYQNINELRVYMTDSMKEWADEYIRDERQDDYSGQYNSINTTALATKVIKLTEDEASVLVLTEREVLSETQDRNFQQHIIINFSQVDADWKVNGIFWL